MLKNSNINPDELKTIRANDRFKIEEVGNSDTGKIHNEMFIDGFMTVDEIIYAVKKYEVKKVWYRAGTDKTHTFPLIIKMRDINNNPDYFGDVEFSFPVFHERIRKDKEWRTIYNHSI